MVTTHHVQPNILYFCLKTEQIDLKPLLILQVVLERDPQWVSRGSMLEAICRKDTALWKSARSQFHHLLMAGMIWENESKRKLAEVFTKVKFIQRSTGKWSHRPWIP